MLLHLLGNVRVITVRNPMMASTVCLVPFADRGDVVWFYRSRSVGGSGDGDGGGTCVGGGIRDDGDDANNATAAPGENV